MKTCPMCEGKKVVGKLIYSEEPRTVRVLGKDIPLIGEIADQRCGTCGGMGEVSEDRYLELAGGGLLPTDQ